MNPVVTPSQGQTVEAGLTASAVSNMSSPDEPHVFGLWMPCWLSWLAYSRKCRRQSRGRIATVLPLRRRTRGWKTDV
jgi:hypothetical protein